MRAAKVRSVVFIDRVGKGISFLCIMPVGADTLTPTRPTPGAAEEPVIPPAPASFYMPPAPGRADSSVTPGAMLYTTRLSTCTHREGISYMTQMRTQTRGETLCDLVCGWLMDKTDVCRCLRLGATAGRPRARAPGAAAARRCRCTRPAIHMLRQRPLGPGRASGPPNLVQM